MADKNVSEKVISQDVLESLLGHGTKKFVRVKEIFKLLTDMSSWILALLGKYFRFVKSRVRYIGCSLYSKDLQGFHKAMTRCITS